MKVTFENFYYKGEHIKKYTCELPQVKEINDNFVEGFMYYVAEILDEFIQKEEKAH